MANPLSVAGSGSKYQTLGACPAGYWAGLWHGFFALPALIISLLNSDVGLYESNNNGAWYGYGFSIGIVFPIGSIVVAFLSNITLV
jgi:hypothetical protein